MAQPESKGDTMKGLIACFGWMAIVALISTTPSHAFYQPGSLGQVQGTIMPPSQEGVPEGFWKMEEGTLLRHFEHGQGRPVLVVHGGPGIPPYQSWKGLKKLDQDFRFVYYHQRGCGESTRPVDRFESQDYLQNMQTLDKELGMNVQISDIERIRIILNQEKLILIGHSFGGFMATLYALEFPDRVDRMVLISPAEMLHLPSEQGGVDQLRRYLSEEMQKEYADFLARYFDFGTIFTKSDEDLAALNAGFGRFYEAALKAKGIDLPAEMFQIKGSGGWSVYALYFSLGQQWDYREKIKTIEVPTLVIHGARDVYSEKTSQEYADLLPNGKLTVLDEASHFAFEESPDAFSALLGAFLIH
jgi:proline iminopeptidase